MIYGIGTDIAEIARVEKVYAKHGSHFIENLLTPEEIKILEARNGKGEFIAGRWAAKEAFAKALGTGIGKDCSFADIEILPDENCRPVIANLYGQAAITVKNRGISRIHVSISHEKEYAVAFVVMEAD